MSADADQMTADVDQMLHVAVQMLMDVDQMTTRGWFQAAFPYQWR